MINQLVPGEIAVLRALGDQRPRWSVEIAQLTDLPPFAVRSICKSLVRRRLAQRGNSIDLCGAYTITEHGLSELHQNQQLRLVGGRDVA